VDKNLVIIQVILSGVCGPKFMKVWENVRGFCSFHAAFRLAAFQLSLSHVVPKLFTIRGLSRC